MSGQLENVGVHFDVVNKIRILDPEAAVKIKQIEEESKEFIQDVGEFKKIADEYISIANALSQEVEIEKIRTIGAQNLVKSMQKDRESRQQLLQALLLERSTELERLRLQHQSLLRIEKEQMETMDRLLMKY